MGTLAIGLVPQTRRRLTTPDHRLNSISDSSSSAWDDDSPVEHPVVFGPSPGLVIPNIRICRRECDRS